ncbi:MAG: type VI secretion system tip protein VgrG [Myxococcota bacterium]|nr:type VI secretion system tip protein VgrG [Myxococcota bacterium]
MTDFDPPPAPEQPEVETTADAARAAGEEAEAAQGVVGEIREGDAGGAIGAGVSGAGNTLAPLLDAASVSDEDTAAVRAVATAVGAGISAASESAARIDSATDDGARAGAATTMGAQLAGGALGGATGIAERLGASQGELSALSIASDLVSAVPAIEQSVRSIAEMVHHDGSSDQGAVRYHIRFPGHDETWTLREIVLTETLNRPFLARLVLSSEDDAASPELLLGVDADVTIERSEAVRHLHGIVSRVEHGERVDEATLCTIEVVPALAALAHWRDNRIFQHLTVPDLLEVLLGEHLAPYRRELEVHTSRDRDPREIVVQWDESVLDFAHRLMEEDGLSYYFTHDERGPEKLVIVDHNEQFPAVELRGGAHVLFIPGEGDDHAFAEPVTELRVADQIGVTDVVVRDWDWTRAEPPTHERAQVQAEDRSDPEREPIIRESFEADGRIAYSRYDKSLFTYGANDAPIQAALRAEAHRMSRNVFTGRSRATRFSPGHVFDLLGHPVGAFDQGYLLTHVRHVGRNPRFAEREASAAAGASARPEYECTFTCIVTSVPHRPARTTPRPRIHGVQTAIVVGPKGEEIYCDEHGRIRVQFAWDRGDADPEKRTCWVRCMQSWAGYGFGTFFLPRVGMEVIVTFLAGDPDRPLVTGCVYDGHRTTPYELPDHKTRSTIRTQSTPFDGGYNEIRFEDKGGSEEVFIHAQKDLNEVVEHDHTTHTKNDQANTVDANRTHHVGAHETIAIGGSQSITVRSESQGDLPTQGASLTVQDGDYEVTVGKKIVITATDSIELIVGDSFLKIEPDKITLHQKDDSRLVLDPGRAELRSKQDSVLLLNGDAQLTAKSGADLTLTRDAQLTGSTAQVLLTDDALMTSGSGAQVHLTGDAVVSGASATLDAQASATVSGGVDATLTAGPSTVKCDSTAAKVTSMQVDISGNATVNVVGGLIKLN